MRNSPRGVRIKYQEAMDAPGSISTEIHVAVPDLVVVDMA